MDEEKTIGNRPLYVSLDVVQTIDPDFNSKKDSLKKHEYVKPEDLKVERTGEIDPVSIVSELLRESQNEQLVTDEGSDEIEDEILELIVEQTKLFETYLKVYEEQLEGEEEGAYPEAECFINDVKGRFMKDAPVILIKLAARVKLLQQQLKENGGNL